jgi:hypothetical protein
VTSGNSAGQSHKTTNQRKPKQRKFYIISYSVNRNRADFEVENEDVLLATSRTLHPPLSLGAHALFPPPGRRGFPAYPERPRMVIGRRKSGRSPSDIELYHSYWLISDRLKSLFEAFDAPAFEFQACDVKLANGSTGPVFWLCDVVRVLDAFAESTLQEIRGHRERTGKTDFVFRSEKTLALAFNETVIGNLHIFRTPYSQTDVFCDQALKDACKEIGIKGTSFYACTHK